MAEPALLLALSYLVGSIPFGLMVGKAWGALDVREYGSGNIGTSNVMRTLGRVPALLVLALDVLKGVLPVAVAGSYGFSPWVVGAAAFLAVAGHVWSVFLKFNGGKGIATTLGVTLGLDVTVAAALVVLWVGVLLITRFISVASLVAATCLPVFLWILGHPTAYVIGGALISLTAFWRHRSNLQRLRKGTEYRLGERAGRVHGR